MIHGRGAVAEHKTTISNLPRVADSAERTIEHVVGNNKLAWTTQFERIRENHKDDGLLLRLDFRTVMQVHVGSDVLECISMQSRNQNDMGKQKIMDLFKETESSAFDKMILKVTDLNSMRVLADYFRSLENIDEQQDRLSIVASRAIDLQCNQAGSLEYMDFAKNIIDKDLTPGSLRDSTLGRLYAKYLCIAFASERPNQNVLSQAIKAIVKTRDEGLYMWRRHFAINMIEEKDKDLAATMLKGMAAQRLILSGHV